MKTVFLYIRFFFYTAFNWNIWLAFFMLYYDIRGAFRYRIRRTFAPVKLNRLTVISADVSKSSPYEAVNYYILEKLFTAIRKLSPSTSIIDLGCGKGRAMVVSVYYGFTDITGIEFAKELCEEAEFNMKKTQTIFPAITWKVINANVLDYNILPGDSVFFLFNPFVEETLDSFLAQLEDSCRLFPRKTWFMYASPLYAATLEKRGYNIVFQHSLMNLKGLILTKD